MPTESIAQPLTQRRRPERSAPAGDLAGNMTNDRFFNYTYNAENQQTQAAGVTYKYDGDGKRVQKVNGTLYWYGAGSDVLSETDSSGALLKDYVYFGGKRIAYVYNSSVYFYWGDHLGNSRVITNSIGGPCYQADLGPYGKEAVAGTPTCTQNYKFTGKERDTETGNDYFGARFYENNLGRFTSPDSTAYVKPINPQSFDLYGYAINNPLLYVDPTGNRVSLANCRDKQQCVQVITAAAELPKGVTATWDKNGNLVLKGDISKIKGGNAARLMQLVQSDKTANFWIGDQAPRLGGGAVNFLGGLSGLTSQGYNQNFAVVQADPSKVDSGDLRGVFLGADGSTTPGEIPGANIDEAAAHELLGHVWADLVGGEAAGSQGNMKEALISEDRVRNTDPSRGLKIRHQDSPQLIKATDLPRITNPGGEP